MDPSAAYAIEPHEPGTCTHDEGFDVPYAATIPGEGLISTIVENIKTILYRSVAELFFHILGDSTFKNLLGVALTIYIAIYGIMFTFGMVQVTVYDFFGRMVKIGLIYWLVSGGIAWWTELLLYLWRFFNDGTDHIIAEITSIAVGGIVAPVAAGGPPFAIFDQVIATAVSAKMAVTILATFFTGPYGIMFALLLLMSLGTFLMALLTAIWVYIMALVLRTLLIGLAPIFIAFILFNRTRHLFDNWINQLVNSCLQPIFMFIFFAFFVTLIMASMSNILTNPVCWTEWIDSVRGTQVKIHYWRFAVFSDETGDWEPYSGLWSWEGATGEETEPFPINIIHILIFLTLAELAGRFNTIIVMIASDIAGASTNFAAMQGALSQWMGGGGRNYSPPVGDIQRSSPGSSPRIPSPTGDRSSASTRDRLANMVSRPRS